MKWAMAVFLLVAVYGTLSARADAPDAPDARDAPDGRDAGPLLWTMDWSPDDRFLVVGGVNTLRLLNAQALERKRVFLEERVRGPQKTFTVTAVRWRPSRNAFAATSQNGDVNGIYDASAGRQLPLRVGQGRGVAWSPDGQHLATTGSEDGHLRIFRVDGTLQHDTPRYGQALGLTGVAWRPGGDLIVTVGKYITLHRSDGRVIKQIVHREEANLRLCLLLCVHWHPSGDFFAVGDYGNEVDDPVLQFWSSEGRLIKSLGHQHAAEIRNIAWSRDGNRLASASDRLRVWTREGRLMHQGESPDLLWGLTWNRAGDRLATSSEQGRVTLWDAKANVLKTTLVRANSTGKAE